jgi:hypothetical protein
MVVSLLAGLNIAFTSQALPDWALSGALAINNAKKRKEKYRSINPKQGQREQNRSNSFVMQFFNPDSC